MDIMIDIETMSTQSNAVIASIGIVAYKLFANSVGVSNT